MQYKILYTIPNFITAGSGRAMLNVIERLDRNVFAPTVCVLKRGGALERELEKQQIPLLEAPFTVLAKPYATLLFRAWKAARFFRPYQFDLWHSFHYSDDYTEPIIARMSGARAWIYTKKNMGWNRRSWYLRSLFASQVAAQNSTMIRQFFTTSRLRSKVELIPPGADIELYRPASGRGHFRSQFGISANDCLLGTVAHLVPVKGHPTLIEAMSLVPNVHLCIVGKPADRAYTQSLHDLCRRFQVTDRVHFTGGVDDVPGLLNELDIFVLPTWRKWRMEGCPVALLEAMSAGLPCIATIIPGCDDVVFPGENGLLVPPEDPVALAHAIRTLVQDPDMRARLGEAARQRIVDSYTTEHEAARYRAVYARLSGAPFPVTPNPILR